MAASMVKRALRKEMKTILSSMSPEQRLLKSKSVTNQVLGHDVYMKSSRIAIFLSLQDEIETEYLLKDIFSQNKLCFIPKYDMNSRQMDMLQLYSLHDLDKLPLTKWHVKQPADADTSRPNALLTGGLDLMLIPGLAFTSTGKRLGRGKGYYDTFLNEHRAKFGRCPPTMALAFKEQVLYDVPTDEHDFIIDTVIHDL